MLRTIRNIGGEVINSGKPVKVYSWISCSVQPIYWQYGPLSQNKDENLHITLPEEADRSGRSLEELSEEVRCGMIHELSTLTDTEHQAFLPVTGELIQIPGLPRFFDYEMYPQQVRSCPFTMIS